MNGTDLPLVVSSGLDHQGVRPSKANRGSPLRSRLRHQHCHRLEDNNKHACDNIHNHRFVLCDQDNYLGLYDGGNARFNDLDPIYGHCVDHVVENLRHYL